MKNWLEKKIEYFVGSTFFFSVLDLFLTLYEIENNIALEANPLLTPIIKISIPLFVVVKIVLTFCCLVFLYYNRKNLMGFAGILFCFVVYLALILYHVAGLTSFYLT